MILEKLKEELIQSLNRHFPTAKINIKEKRGIILELRATISEKTFIEIYANVITEKRSFSLISDGVRITGYDNYKLWHYHPPHAPNKHLPCPEPEIDKIFSSFKDIVDTL